MENNQNAALQQYAESVREKIRELAPEVQTTVTRQVFRNIGEKLVVRTAEPGIGVSMELETCFESGTSVGQVAERFIQDLSKRKLAVIHVKDTYSWDEAKDNIYPCLSNPKSVLWLGGQVQREYLDLTVSYEILIQGEDCIASKKVYDYMLDQWGIDEDTLYEQAVDNLRKKDAGVISFVRLFAHLQLARLIDMYGEEEANEIFADYLQHVEEKIFLWSNIDHHNGAAVMLLKDRLKDFYEEKGCGRYVYILPSSVHELILVCSDTGMGADELRNMVMDVNANNVPEDIYLSDSIYIYDGMTGEIEIYDEAAAKAV